MQEDFHEFTLVLEGSDDLDESLANRIFEAGCSDCTPHLWKGSVYLEFTRSSTSLDEAIQSAIQQLKQNGLVAHKSKS